MRSSASKYFVLLGAVALSACAGKDNTNPNSAILNGGGGTPPATGGTSTTTGGTASGTGGTTAVTGGTGTGGTTTGGTGTGGTTTGGTGTGGTTTGGTGTGGAATGGTGGGATGGTGGGAVVGGDIITVVPSSGCGAAADPADGEFMIAVSGTKTDCARAGCGGLAGGAWTDNRQYSIRLPTPYDKTKPYMLVFEGPGCGGNSPDIYPYTNNADNTIIRVGVSPSHNDQIQASHGTNPGDQCFDDKEGDDSVDFVLYEHLYDLLETQLCFDKHRVFFGGNSSGAWWSNEHGCKYAGDATRPVRGIMPNTGGLPSEPQFKPTCTTNGMAGMWVHEINDGTNPFTGNIYAINRAMTVNGCVAAQTYDTATFEDFPIPNNGANTCKRIVGCDPLYPLVVCPLPGNMHGSHDNVVNPGVSTFLQSFLAAPLAP